MFNIFGSIREYNEDFKDILNRSARMEKYYMEKAMEYAKYNVDVNSMVAKFKDEMIGEHDSATINRIVDTYAKYYRQGIEDTLKKIKLQR